MWFAWLVHHKLMAAMAERDALEPLAGNVQLDDACLGGERPGVGGRGSPNKVPIVAAVSTCDAGVPMRVAPCGSSSLRSAALPVRPSPTGPRPISRSGGGYKAFKFNQYASHCLGAFGCRFNHRVDLQALLQCLIGNAATSSASDGACNSGTTLVAFWCKRDAHYFDFEEHP